MNKEDSHIDDDLETKFEQHDFGTPPESFLVDINKRLDKKALINPFQWWILELVLLLTFGSLLFYGQYNQNSVRTSKNADEVNLLQQTEAMDTILPTPPKTFNKQLEERGNAKASNELKEPRNTTQSQKHEGVNMMKGKSTSQPKHDRTQPNINESAEVSIKEEKQFKSESHQKDPKKTSTLLTNKKQINTVNKVDNENDIPSEEIKSFDTKSVTTEKWADNQGLNKFDVYATEFDIVDHHLKNKPFQNVSYFSVVQNTVPTIKPTAPKDSSAIKTSDKNKGFHFEIQAFGGISYGFPRITKSFSDSYSEQLKNGTENDDLGPHFGINLNVVRKNIVLGTGVHYFQFEEEIDYTKIQTSITDTILVIPFWDYTYDTLGNIIDSVYNETYDSTQVTTHTEKKMEIEQQYSWISIPLQIGYQFNLGRNWAITPRIGGNIAFGILRKTYHYPSSDFQQTDDYQSVRWMLSLQGDIEIRRKIKNWHVFLRGGYHFGLTPYIKVDNLQRKYTQVTGVLGIGYSF